jgi:hypothetical protein
MHPMHPKEEGMHGLQGRTGYSLQNRNAAGWSKDETEAEAEAEAKRSIIGASSDTLRTQLRPASFKHIGAETVEASGSQ